MTDAHSFDDRARLGAAIMRRYRHPESWIRGEETGLGEYRGCMLLLLEELRIGAYAQVSLEEARNNAACVLAFLHSVSLLELGEAQVQCKPNQAPYLVIPTANGNWETALEALRTL